MAATGSSTASHGRPVIVCVQEGVFISRALVLIAVLFFREFLLRPARRSPPVISPYMNSLDGLLSAEKVSLAVDEVRLREFQLKREETFAASSADVGDPTPVLH